jgi:hypothetical protein
MCTSYKAGKDIDFRALFDATPPLGEWREEVYKDYAAPIILSVRPAGGRPRLRHLAWSRASISRKASKSLTP